MDTEYGKVYLEAWCFLRFAVVEAELRENTLETLRLIF